MIMSPVLSGSSISQDVSRPDSQQSLGCDKSGADWYSHITLSHHRTGLPTLSALCLVTGTSSGLSVTKFNWQGRPKHLGDSHNLKRILLGPGQAGELFVYCDVLWDRTNYDGESLTLSPCYMSDHFRRDQMFDGSKDSSRTWHLLKSQLGSFSHSLVVTESLTRAVWLDFNDEMIGC